MALVKIEPDEETQDDEEQSRVYLTKGEIEELIKNDPSKCLVFAQNEKYKSGVWLKFRTILFKGVKQNFVKCKWCDSVLSYKSKTGTASLLRHRCVFTADRRSKRENKTRTKSIKKDLSDEIKTQIFSAQLYFISRDRCFTYCSNSEEFQKLGQTLINLGANYGRRDIEEVFPDNKYLLDTLLPLKVHQIKEVIKTLINNDLSMSVEIWDDKYLILQGRVIDPSHELKSFMLGSRTYDGYGEQLLIIDILKEYFKDSHSKYKESFVVVNDGLYEKEDFRSCQRVHCSSTSLEKILKGVLTEIPHSLSNIEGDDLKLFNKLDDQLIPECMGFLEPLKKCYESLIEDRVNIGDVCLWKKKLENCCLISNEDSPEIIAIKEKTNKLIDDHFKIDQVHMVAVFLNPSFKGLKMFSLVEKTEVYELVQRLMNEMKSVTDIQKDTCKVKTSSKPASVFSEFVDASSVREESIDDELCRYINLKEDYPENILQFWKEHTDFPHLRKLAKKILSVPACSSNYGNKDNLFKQGLSLQEMNSFLFLNKNFKLI